MYFPNLNNHPTILPPTRSLPIPPSYHHISTHPPSHATKFNISSHCHSTNISLPCNNNTKFHTMLGLSVRQSWKFFCVNHVLRLWWLWDLVVRGDAVGVMQWECFVCWTDLVWFFASIWVILMIDGRMLWINKMMWCVFSVKSICSFYVEAVMLLDVRT